jgi:hypothetical protein
MTTTTTQDLFPQAAGRAAAERPEMKQIVRSSVVSAPAPPKADLFGKGTLLPPPHARVRRPHQLAGAARPVRPPHKMGRASEEASARLNRFEDRFNVVGRSSVSRARRPRKIDPKFGTQLQLPL